MSGLSVKLPGKMVTLVIEELWQDLSFQHTRKRSPKRSESVALLNLTELTGHWRPQVICIIPKTYFYA